MKQWRFYITDDAGQSYYVDNGVVMTSGTPRELPEAPDGWDEMLIAWERNWQKFGIIRNFSIPLNFVLDGAKILRSICYTNNIEKKVYLVIKQLNAITDNVNYRFEYEHYYKGELDLSTFNDDKPVVRINIMEGGLSKQLKANEATTYEKILDDGIIVALNGIKFKQEAIFALIDDLEIAADVFNGKAILPFILTNESTDGLGTSGFKSQDIEGTVVAPLDYIDTSFNWFHENNTIFEQQVRIQGRFYGYAVQAGPGGIRPTFLKSSQTTEGDNDLVPGGIGLSDDEEFDIPVDMTITLQAGETLFFYQEMNACSIKFYPESVFTITTSYRHKTTYIKCHHADTIYKELVKGITGSYTYAKSDLLDAYKNIVLTSGDAIRGLGAAKIKTTMNDFSQFAHVVHKAGISIENNKIELELKSKYFSTTTVTELGRIKNLKVSNATDIIGNNIKIGYLKADISDVNGKYEFNNTHEYGSPIQRVTREINLVCPYKAGPYEIEIKRINLEGKTTTDNTADNQVYILNIDYDHPVSVPGVGDTVYNLKRETYTSITGIPTESEDSIFNVEHLTPLRRLVDHSDYLNSLFYGFAGSNLTFQTTEQNADLWTIGGPGGSYYEKSDRVIQDSPLIFIPKYFEFDTEVPVALTALMEEDPNRCFSFEWENVTYKGFLIKAGIASTDRKEQAFKLLSTADNDFSKLI